MWPDAGWEATVSSWGAQVTCRECGAQNTAAAGVCARCGAPLGLEQPTAAAPPAFGPGPTGGPGNPAPPAGWPGTPAPPAGWPGTPAPPAGWPGNPAPPAGWPGNPAPPAGWPGTPAPPAGAPGGPGAPMPWDPLYYWAPGQQPSRRNSPRWALIMAGAGGALLLVLIVVFAVRGAGNPPAPSTSTPPASTQAPTVLSFDELAPGDCLAGSNMSLGNTSTPWPDYVTQVPCTQRHEAEVFFAGDLWPQSAAYPGKSAIDNETWTRCNTTFTKYDGLNPSFEGNDPPNSAFTFTDIAGDGSADWADGQRHLVCVAYKPDFNNATSGATPVNYSIKGTKK